MKNKLFFLCFTTLMASVIVKSQSKIAVSFPPLYDCHRQTVASVPIPQKLDNVNIYLSNYQLLLVTMRFTNVDDNTEYMFYPVTDFPVSNTTVYVGSIPAGIYDVEIGDYGPSPILKNGKTDCDLQFNKQGEPLYWYNHAIGNGCDQYFTVAKVYL